MHCGGVGWGWRGLDGRVCVAGDSEARSVDGKR